MTLFDATFNLGAVKAIGGDPETHRRLVDMGLLDAEYSVKARRRSAVLADFGEFAAVVSATAAEYIEVAERRK